MHSQHKFIPEGLSVFLDNARWLAAFLVVINHVNTRFFPKFSQTDPLTRSVADFAWAFFAGFSHHAVVIFFVLSGYLVGGRVLLSMRSRASFEWKRYLVDRFARIYLVLVPVLGLTYLLDSFGLDKFGLPVYGYELDEVLSLEVLFGNFLNLQDFWVPPFGTNGPLYTLANEFWYYIAFPMLLAPLIMAGSVRWLICLAGVALTVLLVSMSPWHGVGFALWILGACTALLPVSRLALHFRACLWVFVLYLVIVRLAVRGDEVAFWIRSLLDVGAALCCCLVIYTLRSGETLSSSGLAKRWSKLAADCSFSLYAIHVPILNLFSAYLNQVWGFGYKSGVQGVTQWLLIFLMLAVIWGFAILFGAVTEARTLGVRMWAYRRLRVV